MRDVTKTPCGFRGPVASKKKGEDQGGGSPSVDLPSGSCKLNGPFKGNVLK